MTWHKDFFDDPEYRNNYSFLTQERTAREVAFLDKLFKEHNVTSVLDVPCGFGRHAIELAKLQYVVHGIDLFKVQLDTARKIIEEEGLELPNLTFKQDDMRYYHHTPDGSQKYDAVINMFMSFGYYSREEDKKILLNFCNSVAKNGLLFMEIRNPYYFLPNIISSNYSITETDEYGRENVTSFDPLTSKLSIMFDGNKKTEMNIYFPMYYKEFLEGEGFDVKIELKKHRMHVIAKNSKPQ